jgi:hypothetical protein
MPGKEQDQAVVLAKPGQIIDDQPAKRVAGGTVVEQRRRNEREAQPREQPERALCVTDGIVESIPGAITIDANDGDIRSPALLPTQGPRFRRTDIAIDVADRHYTNPDQLARMTVGRRRGAFHDNESAE